jgi:hypothetical protein
MKKHLLFLSAHTVSSPRCRFGTVPRAAVEVFRV